MVAELILPVKTGRIQRSFLMCSLSRQEGPQFLPPVLVSPVLPHVRRNPEQGLTIVNEGGQMELLLIDCPEMIAKLHDHKDLERPNGPCFAAQAFWDTELLPGQVIFHERQERTLMDLVARIIELGRLPLLNMQPTRVRIVDCYDRKAVVTDLPKRIRHVILGAVQEECLDTSGNRIMGWRPHSNDYTFDQTVDSPLTAMLMVVQNLIERGVWK